MSSSISVIKSDPVGSAKAFIFMVLALIVLFVLWKVLKGISKGSELLSDLAPSTEAEKEQVISSPAYQDGVKWLDPMPGIVAATKSKWKKPSAYLTARGVDHAALGRVATEIWDAKVPAYISSTEVYKAISSLPSKAAISLMAGVFNQYYEKKFNGGTLSAWLGKYLKLGEMQVLANIINKKPEL